jgi:hypothetical protein
MPPIAPLLVSLLVGLILLALALRPSGRWSALLAVLPLLDAALLVAFVFGEDDYRRTGFSRWDAYRSPGGALGPMFVASVALLTLSAGLLFYSGVRDRRSVFRTTAAAAGLVTLLLVTPTILGFSLN